MGRACSTDGGKRRDLYRVWWGNVKERDHSEDPGVDGRRLILNGSLGNGME